MSKYEIEIPDAEVSELASVLSDRGGWGEVVRQLREQIPIPVPVKIGAVVLTNGATDNRLPSGNNYFIRWAHDNATTSPWIEAGNHEEPYRTDAIGRITEVLSPGVDL